MTHINVIPLLKKWRDGKENRETETGEESNSRKAGESTQ
jgi:hypothetical protein